MRIEKFIETFPRGVSKVLDVFLENQNDQDQGVFTFKDLLGKSHIGTGTLHRALSVLSEQGIIKNCEPKKSSRGQLAQTWTLDRSSPMIKILMDIRKFEVG